MAGSACNPLDPDARHPVADRRSTADDPAQISAKDRDAPLVRRRSPTRGRAIVKLFVTGAAGFIGSNYVRWVLANTDDEITVFDKLTYAGNLANIDDVLDDRRCRFVHADICDQDAVTEHLPGHDAVVHFAAESHVDRSIADPYAFVTTNTFGTNVLCDVALRAEVSEVPPHLDRRGVRLDRARARSPRPIGSRRARRTRRPRPGSDLIALSYHTTYGLPVVVTRCSNNYGPYQFPEKLIPLFTTNLLDGTQRAADGRRRQRPRLDPRRGSQSRRSPRARAGRRRRDLQHRRAQRDHQPRHHDAAARADRPRRVVHRVGTRSTRSRPSLLRRDRQDQHRSDGSSSATSMQGLEHTVELVPRSTATGGSRSRPGPGSDADLDHRRRAASSVTTSSLHCGVIGDDVIATDRQRLDIGDRDAGARGGVRPAARRDRQRRCLDSGRRLRGRPGAGASSQRARASVVARGERAERRSSRAAQHRLRVRRHPRPAVPRVGSAEPSVGVRAVEAGRRASRPARTPRSYERRGCAAANGNNIVKTVLAAGGRAPVAQVRRRSTWLPDVHGRPGADGPPAGGRTAVRRASRHEPGRRQLVRVRPRRSSSEPATTRDMVEPISTADLQPPRPAPRPANSVLDNVALRERRDPAAAALPRTVERAGRTAHRLIPSSSRTRSSPKIVMSSRRTSARKCSRGSSGTGAVRPARLGGRVDRRRSARSRVCG